MRVERTFHVNMLKPFVESTAEEIVALCAPVDKPGMLPLPVLPWEEQFRLGMADVVISEQLPPEAQEQARRVLEAHREIFSSTWVHHRGVP